MSVPVNRIQTLVERPPAPGARYVLYWMIANRRLGWNFALEHAVDWASRLGLPLVILEPLRIDYPWASDRLHQFVLDGMAETAQRLASRPGVGYLPYVEPERGAGKGLLPALAAEAAVVVTDDFPAFIVPQMLDAAARQLNVRLDVVDANGLLPIHEPGRVFPTAYTFRRHLQRTLPGVLRQRPLTDPLSALTSVERVEVSARILTRWPSPAASLLNGSRTVASLPVSHAVPAVGVRGGTRAAEEVLNRFVVEGLPRYGEARNRVEADTSSRLSPYLHFGHIGSWQVIARLLDREGWVGVTSARAAGAREGWWGVAPEVEGYLDQIVTWRELGFNMCVGDPDGYDRFESLPPWALATLGKHEADQRTYRYGLDAFEAAATHDPLWNAAQRQLRTEGRIHNYLRMLWGKKILEWSTTPRDALAVMIELNNKYALDGRDPNSYSGIFWTLGRYDRPWAPERPVFGTVRYMSSENTARKMPVSGYIRRYAEI
jgi:deoxyribodipyrimidine photo-lyase